jgi:hypothetical protein
MYGKSEHPTGSSLLLPQKAIYGAHATN